jgi:biopolymer transport protein ExbD
MSEDQPQSAKLQGTSFTEPFAFRERLRCADSRIDFIPVLDMIVIAMLVSLLFTRFVSLPGVRVDLPVTEMRMQHVEQAVAVLTIGNNGMLFFNGAVYEPGTIQRGFRQYVENSDGAGPVLLIKADHSMQMQGFLRLCELAKSAGFVQVQLAGKKKAAAEEILPETPGGPGEF